MPWQLTRGYRQLVDRLTAWRGQAGLAAAVDSVTRASCMTMQTREEAYAGEGCVEEVRGCYGVIAEKTANNQLHHSRGDTRAVDHATARSGGRTQGSWGSGDTNINYIHSANAGGVVVAICDHGRSCHRCGTAQKPPQHNLHRRSIANQRHTQVTPKTRLQRWTQPTSIPVLTLCTHIM